MRKFRLVAPLMTAVLVLAACGNGDDPASSGGGEPWLAPLLSTVTVEEVSIQVPGRRLVADLYRPAAPRGALLLVHGLSITMSPCFVAHRRCHTSRHQVAHS